LQNNGLIIGCCFLLTLAIQLDGRQPESQPKAIFLNQLHEVDNSAACTVSIALLQRLGCGSPKSPFLVATTFGKDVV
jgi:hypothetical protein